MTKPDILSIESTTKTARSARVGWLCGSLQLAPGRLSGHEVCPNRGHCFTTCLFYSGQGGLGQTQQTRIRRTKLLFENPRGFEYLLGEDIEQLIQQAEIKGLRPALRLNTFSDVPWEDVTPELFKRYPDVQFYDYTKTAARWLRSLHPEAGAGWPRNYHLTYSWNEKSERELELVSAGIKAGGSVTIVLRENRNLPALLLDLPTADGDQHDATFMHPPGSVIVLAPKGLAKTKRTEFIP